MTQKERINLAKKLNSELRRLGWTDEELEEARLVAIELNQLLKDALTEAPNPEKAFEWHAQIIEATRPVNIWKMVRDI